MSSLRQSRNREATERWMAGALLRLLTILFSLCTIMPAALAAEAGNTTKGEAVIDGCAAIATTDEHFICATLDWAPSETCRNGSCPWINASILNLNLSNRVLLNVVKAFSPLKLRLGGSLEDRVMYESSDLGCPCVPFVMNDSALFGFNEGCLPMSRWDQLNEFFKKSRSSVIFGLNALNGRVPMQDGSLGGPWNYTNAESLVRYTTNKGYNILGWELGNELSGKGIQARIGVAQYAADMISLKKVMDGLYKDGTMKPLLIAPGGNFEAEWYSKFIELTKLSSSLDVITHHMYILGPGTDDNLVEKILDPSHLDGPASVFNNLSIILRNAGSSVNPWVGEAGGAYNGGRNLVTNSFVSSFWYLDQLGMSATYNTKVFCRQSLIGGNYGLLNTSNFKPNPDYYSALLWHRLMGPKVLSTNFIGTKKIRAYAHCARDYKGITLLLLNLDLGNTTYIKVSVNGASHSEKTREEYHLSAKDGNLHSQTVLLNGRVLDVNSHGKIPTLRPIEVDGLTPIKLAPISIVFVHLPCIHAPACI
ncbi:heparanase-like protein 3 [Phalaenopsis equestris]|uniref:heparanase-like protein 3 n=1 Tax=Phalaenopsis equestris TaxID=78828 RepID=UPI0009E1A789|nr:heparanase-like protein 3 [Phalaenopsis equestris]